MNDIIELSAMWFEARVLSEGFIHAYCTWADEYTGLADTLGGFTDEFAYAFPCSAEETAHWTAYA